ncbi:MAG: hypothetical protein KGZ88_00960 [Methylomicrobium sp.]|nr:hypothetical protein [Methylomicrobium sp.]
MKNSFYLVIPVQKDLPDRLRLFEPKSLQHWLSELPVTNPGLSTRLFFDLLKELNGLTMPTQFRLDALEIVRLSYLGIEEFLRSKLITQGFPQNEEALKIFNLLITLQKEFTIGYWITLKEQTKKDVSWFQGKHVVLSLQRTISGLCQIVLSHYLMVMPVPDWVWIDIHSIYKLSVKTKKETSKVPRLQRDLGKTVSVDDCYRQILMMSLAQPAGLMQKEVLPVFDFIELLTPYLTVDTKLEDDQAKNQCIVLTDEDLGPQFSSEPKYRTDASCLYLGFEKINKILFQKDKLVNKDQARFSAVTAEKTPKNKLPIELLDYLSLRWQGIELKGYALFSDRLDRCVCIGLDNTHDLLSEPSDANIQSLEYRVQSTSERSLACDFQSTGLISIGSLVSLRKPDAPVNKRSLGVINKLSITKSTSKVSFEIELLAIQVYAVFYQPLDHQTPPVRALIYGVKENGPEKSYIIIESYNLKDGDIVRMFMNKNTFPIILRGRKNIGLGYWQFECRRLEEGARPQNKSISN